MSRLKIPSLRSPKAAKAEEQPDLEQFASTWTGGSALTTKLASIGLWAAIVAGPLAFLMVVGGVGSTPSVVSAKSNESNIADEQAAVGEYASRFVVTWLETPQSDRDRLEEFVQVPSAIQLPELPFKVSNPAVAGLEKSGHDIWTAVVAATVAGLDKAGKATPAFRRYFQVTVSHPADEEFAAMALPSPVSGPSASKSPQTDYSLRMASSDPIWPTTQQFLGALLAGAGDINRYLTPGKRIAAVQPAPYSTVTLSDLRGYDDGAATTATPKDDEVLRVQATVQVENSETQSTVVQYALTLTARAGRWEVTAIDASPLIKKTSPGASAPTASSPPTPLEGESATNKTEEIEK